MRGDVRSRLAALLRGEIPEGDPSAEAWQELLAALPIELWPYLGWRLRESELWGRLPSAVAENLSRVTRASLARHLRQRHALREILGALETGHVPVLVLKGAVLAQTVYPEPALRPMADLDLLVSEQDWPAARAAVASLGYEVPAHWEVRPESGWAAKPEREKPLLLPGAPLAVELHTSLDGFGDPFQVEVGSVWRRAVEVSLQGQAARTLCPEDFLPHVALHLAVSDGFRGGLRPILDVALLVARGSWDWPALVARWRERGIGAWMSLVLRFAQELLAAPVPASALADLPAPPHEARALAIEQIWRGPFAVTPPGLVTVLDRVGWRTRLGMVLARLNPWRWDEASHGWMPALGRASRRLWVDVTTRAPRYGRAWRRGHFSSAHVEEAVALARGRQQLAGLMAPERGEVDPTGAR